MVHIKKDRKFKKTSYGIEFKAPIMASELFIKLFDDNIPHHGLDYTLRSLDNIDTMLACNNFNDITHRPLSIRLAAIMISCHAIFYSGNTIMSSLMRTEEFMRKNHAYIGDMFGLSQKESSKFIPFLAGQMQYLDRRRDLPLTLPQTGTFLDLARCSIEGQFEPVMMMAREVTKLSVIDQMDSDVLKVAKVNLSQRLFSKRVRPDSWSDAAIYGITPGRAQDILNDLKLEHLPKE